MSEASASLCIYSSSDPQIAMSHCILPDALCSGDQQCRTNKPLAKSSGVNPAIIELDSEEISSLTDTQDKVLSLLPILPAIFSVIASSPLTISCIVPNSIRRRSAYSLACLAPTLSRP